MKRMFAIHFFRPIGQLGYLFISTFCYTWMTDPVFDVKQMTNRNQIHRHPVRIR